MRRVPVLRLAQHKVVCGCVSWCDRRAAGLTIVRLAELADKKRGGLEGCGGDTDLIDVRDGLGQRGGAGGLDTISGGGALTRCSLWPGTWASVERHDGGTYLASRCVDMATENGETRIVLGSTRLGTMVSSFTRAERPLTPAGAQASHNVLPSQARQECAVEHSVAPADVCRHVHALRHEQDHAR